MPPTDPTPTPAPPSHTVSPPARPRSRSRTRRLWGWGCGLIAMALFGIGLLLSLEPPPRHPGHPRSLDRLGWYLEPACTQKDSPLQPALNRVLEAWLTAPEAKAELEAEPSSASKTAPTAPDHNHDHGLHPAQPQPQTPAEPRQSQNTHRTARQGDGRELLRLIWTARLEQDQTNHYVGTRHFAFLHEREYIHPAPGTPLPPPEAEDDLIQLLRANASQSLNAPSSSLPVTDATATTTATPHTARSAPGYADERQQWYRFEVTRPRWWESRSTALILRLWTTGPNQRDENGAGDDQQTRIRLRPSSYYRPRPPTTWPLKTHPADSTVKSPSP